MVERLARLGLHTLQDLLFHLPLRYQDRTRIAPIGSLRPGNEITVRGEVQLTDIKLGRRRMLLSRIADGSGAITLRFFYFSAAQRAGLARGSWVQCFGEVRAGPSGLEMVHPEYRLIDPDTDGPLREDTLTPVYPSTEGLRQQTLRKLIDQLLDDPELLGECLPELLPAELLAQRRLPGLREAILYVHRPPAGACLRELEEGTHPAQQRLAFEELLAHQLSLRQLRERQDRHAAPPLRATQALQQPFLDHLGFPLTAAQRRVLDEIAHDLTRPRPMQRLVQGDVGCGKTVVAALAALQALEAGFQVAIMAPTELLAEQHRRNFAQWLAPLDIDAHWLSGKTKGKAREQTLAAIADGNARLTVGTQALFQEGVEFHDLGLVIIDEQHRFGVHQRLALREKGARDGRYPHQLIMTATPIPRTLAQTAYADLDISVIDELPPGRSPVETVVIADDRRDAVVARVHAACREGRQAYWVCTLIEESESLQCETAQATAEALHAALPDLRIGLIHGRLKAAEKEAVMARFKAGDIDLLVATTVIEVGVDVPNASLMIIENAERLGLSQLHQLRGRVGRGSARSSCVLLYKPPLSKTARQRLATLRETNDGFEVARKDLELRGPGELLGTKQTGLLELRIADLQRDQALIPDVGQCAAQLLREHPGQVAPLIRRWLGDGLRYGSV
ncbi:MAG TPA: ATP-dependent DNA helicase RecG [Gammaproteobacteria bacterium]|nr:ATP-dependent DNA helicase RecG [Gammaproteobacteria bacterium]